METTAGPKSAGKKTEGDELKKIWIVLAILICLAAIIGGDIYWHHKISKTTAEAATAGQTEQALNATESGQPASPDKARDKRIAKLPAALQKNVQAAIGKHEQVLLVMIGGADSQALAGLLQQQLDKTYGADIFKVTANSYGSSDSLALNGKPLSEIIKGAKEPDAVFYTPPVYNDDHQVSTTDTKSVISLIGEKIKAKYPDAAFFVQPPVYSAETTYINDRIDELKKYAKKKDLAYINYLSQWPTGAKQANVAAADGQSMNEKGEEIWLKYISQKWGLVQ